MQDAAQKDSAAMRNQNHVTTHARLKMEFSRKASTTLKIVITNQEKFVRRLHNVVLPRATTMLAASILFASQVQIATQSTSSSVTSLIIECRHYPFHQSA